MYDKTCYVTGVTKKLTGYSGAGSVENRAHPDTSNKLCRTAYWYKLFAKCMLANQKSPYFQDGGLKFKMAAKIYHNTPKPGTISTQQCFLGVKFGLSCVKQNCFLFC